MNELILKNKHFSFTVAADGRVNEIINLYNKENANSTSEDYRFIYLIGFDGGEIYPVSLDSNGEITTFTFENGLSLDMKAETFDNFMTFEIVSELDKSVKGVTFANLKTVYTEKDGEYMLNAIGMTAWTNPVSYGYRNPAPSSVAKAYTIYDKGVKGAKLGIVFSRKEDAIKYLQQLSDTIDPSVGLVSKAGGAYAREWRANFGDYSFCMNLDPDNFDNLIKLMKEYRIEQCDVHQGRNTFLQGDFTFFFTENGTPEEFHEKFGKRLEAAGIDRALHTYAYYIDPISNNILSNPKWQKDLECLPDEYTLSEDIPSDARFIPTVEDSSGFDASTLYFAKTSRYILIDEELIRIEKVEGNGLGECARGSCGTRAVEHKKGAKIYHLSGMFHILTPKLGSELFYYIADRTAEVYNRGGFSMIYLDAIDGIRRHLAEGEESWYYFHMFLHRVVSQCKTPPVLETSAEAPSEWNVRGRSGAWDYSNYSTVSLKRFIGNHVKENLKSISNNMTSTLGWFNFFTDGSALLKNTFQRTMFTDVLDFVGMNALLYDMSMVYNPFSYKSVMENPFHKANVDYYYNTYSKLRKSRYFKDDVLERVKDIGGEWRVIERDGEYFFQRRAYDFVNYGSAIGFKDVLKGVNHFERQTPFIRIESRFSTLFENKTLLVDFDESMPVGDKLVCTFEPQELHINGMVLTTRIKGTGRDGDGMLISIASGARGEADGRRDHFIDLNFEGWREFTLLDSDNADYDVERYEFADIPYKKASYNTFRFMPVMGLINRLTVRTVGETGKNAMIDDVFYAKHTDAPIKSPSVTVDGRTLTFNCEMKGGEYLEYYPEADKAVLYHNAEQTTEEVTFTGGIEVTEGEYTAEFSAEALTEAPLKARLTFGFSGQEIGNQ
ncbi:MAG: hypothetical protein IKV53_05615 [Clostridia bacterium]|nr:hypothetical protein [Clostridia bacterium]